MTRTIIHTKKSPTRFNYPFSRHHAFLGASYYGLYNPLCSDLIYAVVIRSLDCTKSIYIGVLLHYETILMKQLIIFLVLGFWIRLASSHLIPGLVIIFFVFFRIVKSWKFSMYMLLMCSLAIMNPIYLFMGIGATILIKIKKSDFILR